jgi:hypothetical protein
MKFNTDLSTKLIKLINFKIVIYFLIAGLTYLFTKSFTAASSVSYMYAVCIFLSKISDAKNNEYSK